MAKEYIDFDEFYDVLVNRLQVGENWRLECEDNNNSGDENNYTLVFAKHQYEAEDGRMYDFIVYSYPKTLDAGFIQEDINDGWDTAISSVWFDITTTCDLRPFICEAKI